MIQSFFSPHTNTAEETVSTHLRTLGWQILLRHWHCRQGKIDILARDPASQEYVCVEVRSTRPNRTEPSLSWTKYQKLVRSILSLTWLHNKPVRIDLVIVVGKKVTKHYQNLRQTDLLATNKFAYALRQ